MLKNILKLDGAQKLSKKEQKNINGGGGPGSRCDQYRICTGPVYPNTIWVCFKGICTPELID